jgi:mono/diheme cytochrome c family protein
MARSPIYFAVVLGVLVSVVLAVAASPSTSAPSVERGRYLARIAGCNDCHTPGYVASAGTVPETQWLVGDSLGWRGPWGTTYPINLRLYLQGMTEEQWVAVARAVRSRPPMPWFALRDMTEQDLRSLYQFVRSLGPGGGPSPAYVPPEREPSTPYVQFPAPPK